MDLAEIKWLDILVKEIENFQNYSRIEHKTQLETIAKLIETTYSETNNSQRKKNEENLEILKRNIDWKTYSINLCEIIYFSDDIDKNLLERLIIENKDCLYRNGNFQEIETSQLLTLYAANISCILNKSFSIKIKLLLSESLEMLFKIYDFNKSKSLSR